MNSSISSSIRVLSKKAVFSRCAATQVTVLQIQRCVTLTEGFLSTSLWLRLLVKKISKWKINFGVCRQITWELIVVMWDNMLCFCNWGGLKSQKLWAAISDLAGLSLLGHWISCNSELEIKINFLQNLWSGTVFTLWRLLTLFSCFLIMQLMETF